MPLTEYGRGTPCDQSSTVSASGQRAFASHARRSATSASGIAIVNGVAASPITGDGGDRRWLRCAGPHHTEFMSDAPDAPINDDDDELEVETYDLDGDGKVSVIESERARLGIVDARLEEIAESDDGLKGKLAKAAHEVLDKLDND